MDYKLDIDFSEEELREELTPEPSGFDGHFGSQRDNNENYDDSNIKDGSNFGTDDVEKIVVETGPEDIIGGPYTSAAYRRDKEMQKEFPKDILYGSGEIARMLGVTEQTVRNYCNTYADFLDITPVDSSTSNRNRWKLTKKQIEDLRKIIQIKDMNNFTTEQMKSFLADPDNALSVPTDKNVEKAFSALREDMQSIVKQALIDMQKGFDERLALSTSKNSEDMENVLKMQKSIMKDVALSKEKIEELSKAVASERAEAYSKLESENNALLNKVDAQTLVIDELEDKLKKKEEEIKALSDASQQRKKFLGLFSKR